MASIHREPTIVIRRETHTWLTQSWRVALTTAAVGRVLLNMYVQVFINFAQSNTRRALRRQLILLRDANLES